MSIELPPPPREKTSPEQEGQWRDTLWRKVLELFADLDTAEAALAAIDTRIDALEAPVSARYKSSSGQSIPNNTSTIVDFATKDWDTDNAVTTGASWKFTCPTGKAGKYLVAVKTWSATGAGWNLGETWRNGLFKNGSLFAFVGNPEAPTASTARMESVGATVVDLAAGDYIDIRLTQDSGGAVTMAPDATTNHVSIHRIGT